LPKSTLPEEYQGTFEGIFRIVNELPGDGDKQFLELWKKIKESHKGSCLAGKSLQFQALDKPVRLNYFLPLFTFLAMIAQRLR
jgi:hypothetical protein